MQIPPSPCRITIAAARRRDISDHGRMGADKAPPGSTERVDCSEVLEQLADYLDAEARDALCKAIDQHLDHCHDCRFYVDSVKKTIMLYQADRPVEMPSAVTTQLANLLAREYRSAVEDGSSS